MLFDQGVLQVQQVVVGADLLPEPAWFAGVARAEAVSAGRVAEPAHRLTDVVPRAQADSEVVAAPGLPVLAANQKMVHLAAHEPVAEGVADDAADLGDRVHPLLPDKGRLTG